MLTGRKATIHSYLVWLGSFSGGNANGGGGGGDRGLETKEWEEYMNVNSTQSIS